MEENSGEVAVHGSTAGCGARTARRLAAATVRKDQLHPSDGSLAGMLLLSIQNLKVPLAETETFCRRWRVAELSLFGSVLREDFRPDSDVDILISFAPRAEPSLLDHVAMQEELAELFGRRVDLVTRPAIERSSNWIRRRAILGTAQRVYAI